MSNRQHQARGGFNNGGNGKQLHLSLDRELDGHSGKG
jgi:hypothetical protein